MLEIKKNLTDAIISQLSHEKKYAITKDSVFYDQFVSARETFEKSLSEAESLTDPLSQNESLKKIRAYYDQYQVMVGKTFSSLRTEDPEHPTLQRDDAKEKVVNNLLEELKAIEAYYRQDMYARMNAIRDDTAYASRLAVMMLVIALFLVLATAFMSTRSITKPLKVLVEKTKEISEGIFEGDLNISSPPEVHGLSKAVNAMCEKLKKVDTMKSEFFSAMSHELRTPLTSIKQGILLLQQGFEGDIPDKQKKLLAILSQETNRLIEMVSTLLDLSKMEAGMMTYRFHQEKLPPLIQRVVLEMTPLMEAKRIQPKIMISQEIPPLNLDTERILQAVRNLVGNAVKYTPEEGQIIISVFCRDHEVECSFKDTGPGIPKENLKEIFEKFHQLPVRTSEWSKGTGLGLAFVKHIIAAHGGKVWAESTPGQGSTFIFVLPLQSSQ